MWGFPQMVVPKMDGLQGKIPLKWMIWGYPHLWKPSCRVFRWWHHSILGICRVFLLVPTTSDFGLPWNTRQRWTRCNTNEVDLPASSLACTWPTCYPSMWSTWPGCDGFDRLWRYLFNIALNELNGFLGLIFQVYLCFLVLQLSLQYENWFLRGPALWLSGRPFLWFTGSFVWISQGLQIHEPGVLQSVRQTSKAPFCIL